MRSQIHQALKGGIKSKRTMQLIGCTIEELKFEIEYLWQPGTSWDNYGFCKNGGRAWQIDHIRACDKFDLTKPEEQERCFHYSNLQPLWADENQRKNNKSFEEYYGISYHDYINDCMMNVLELPYLRAKVVHQKLLTKAFQELKIY